MAFGCVQHSVCKQYTTTVYATVQNNSTGTSICNSTNKQHVRKAVVSRATLSSITLPQYINRKLLHMTAGSVALDDAMASVLQRLGIADLAQTASTPRAWPHTAPSPCSFTCLAHILQGACMAGHKAALPLIALPLSYLEGVPGQGAVSAPEPADEQPISDPNRLTSAVSGSASTSQAAVSPGTTAGNRCCQAAAAVFEMVPSTNVSVLSLSKDMAHVTVKPLWQQRFYTAALQQLEKLLAQSESAVSLSPEAQSGQGHSQQGALLLALAYLLKGTPAKISKADLPRLLRWLLMALELLQQPIQCAAVCVMAHLLELVKTVMEDPTGRCMHFCGNVGFEQCNAACCVEG